MEAARRVVVAGCPPRPQSWFYGLYSASATGVTMGGVNARLQPHCIDDKIREERREGTGSASGVRRDW